MAQHNAFTWSCEQNIVFPNNVTTTHRDKSNIPGFARARNAIATRIFYIVQVNAPPAIAGCCVIVKSSLSICDITR